MRSRRTLTWLIGLALVVSACGSGAAETSRANSSGEDASQTATMPATEPSTTPATEPGDATAPTVGDRPAPDPNREIAPDVSLLLSDGSTFVLSEETRPVFMVFWAEW